MFYTFYEFPHVKMLGNVCMISLHLPCVRSFAPGVALLGSGEVLILGPSERPLVRSCSNQKTSNNL